ALKNFDLYCAQNFLDNVLRGGYPLSLGGALKRAQIQVYSRKHGDLERDYNKFLLEPSYFSQGNGNYRDVNQNRRSDVWFNPDIKEENILNFFNLIQIDGYNPLVIKPDNFMFKEDSAILNKFLEPDALAGLRERLKKPFSPGELLSFIEQNKIKILGPREEFLAAILSGSMKSYEAEHGEGFWTDHWAYCLDLLESELSIYPENLKELLLEKREFTFFDNWEVLRPRAERYILKNNRVFQYHSVVNNHAKGNLIRKRQEFAHLSRAQQGQGAIYKTSLIVKMLVIIANKFASLDPFGIGVEMEANKPNWYDSLNGLPGLLGSSTCETFELKRWLIFLQDSFKKIGLSKEDSISMPDELLQLILGLKDLSSGNLSDYDFWDKSHNSREEYLKKTLLGFSGREKLIGILELNEIFVCFLNKINSGLQKAYAKKLKLHYSYFINEAVDYKLLETGGSLPVVVPLKFKQIPLPLFLEGPMHYLRIADSQKEARKVFQAVRKSQLYDKKLKMYKVTAPLADMPEEIGRCRVFTPGWLENESIWLHMEYKYLLELVKNGLYKEFFEDFKNVLIPFQNPSRYGRSILENSSFLVSSAFPDERLHGNGFVARLSGSTAEFISIWIFICAGRSPFYLDEDKKLHLEFKPVLPGWLFSRKQENGFPKDTFAFKFLNKAMVVYHNPKRKDTFGKNAARQSRITVEYDDKNKLTFYFASLAPPIPDDVRHGKVSRIDILLA
ncbi:MAG: cellobiose phosphorylase, partial [Patescibacteria group bacterium]